MSVELKTITLRKIVNQLKEEDNIAKTFSLYQFLNEKPIATNYQVARETTCVGERTVVVQLLTRQVGPSIVPLYEHIHISNLTVDCRLTLSETQVKMIENLI